MAKSPEGVFVTLFECDRCGARVAFDAVRCDRCDAGLGYVPEQHGLRVLHDGSEPAVLFDTTAGATWWRCLNAAWGCNWMVSADDGGTWCRSCRLTRGRPDVDRTDAIEVWMRAEGEKRRLVHQLDLLGLPVEARTDQTPNGLVFDLVHVPGEPGVTGYSEGVITLDLLEVDDRHRDALRHQLDESFRTVIGHLRHEIGHHYWDRLVGRTEHVTRFRELFGDERADYGAALDDHYSTAPGSRGDDRFLSDYAASHPHEDWAETFAHYLHILDGTETARAHRLTVDGGRVVDARSMAEIVDEWTVIAEAVNAVAMSLGIRRIYPFVLSDSVVEKLTFVHERIADHTARIHFFPAPS